MTPKWIAEAIAQEFPEKEQQVLTATQGQTASSVFGATIKTAAWKAKPSWCVIASNDRAIALELEKSEAVAHPREVADFIERAAAKLHSR